MNVAEKKQSPGRLAKSAKAIKSVRVLSSGWAEQHKEHRFGSIKPKLWWALTSQSWVELPLYYFLVEHRDGLVLFDTGIDPAIVSDRHYINSVVGRFLLQRIFHLHVSEDKRLDKVLAAEGFQATDVDKAVISHLHFDHVGGIAHIPQAELIVNADEWAQLSEPEPEKEWILREHIEIPQAKWQTFNFESTDDPLFKGFDAIHDVAGDGSMILLPTPGHTAGSVSMLIRNSGWAPILLVADLVYDVSQLQTRMVPGTGDPEMLLESYAKVAQLKQRLPDMVIVPSHDFSASEDIARAISAIE